MSETWGILITLYLFLAGVGAGSFRFAVLTAKKKDRVFDSYADVAALLAPITLAFGLLMLVFDLKYRTRFWFTLTAFNYDSPMSLGVWLLAFFFAVSVLYALFRFHGRTAFTVPLVKRLPTSQVDRLKGLLGLVGVPLALLVSVYTGVLLAITSVPMWRNFALPALFAFSAFACGFAGAATLGGLYRKGKGDNERPLILLTRAYRLILPFYLGAAIIYSVLPPVEGAWSVTGAAHPRGWYALIWWLGVVGLGIVLPYGFLLRRRAPNPKEALFVFACLLAGGFLLRLVLIYAGQSSTGGLAHSFFCDFVKGGLL